MNTLRKSRGFKIVASHNLLPIQYTGVVSALKCFRLIIGFNSLCTGINSFVINGKRWTK